MAADLRVYLTADVGPADAVLGAGHETDGRWEETESGLAITRDALCSIEEQFAAALPVTWFFRADALIEQQFGSRLAIIDRFVGFTQRAQLDGHEIGWLPQVYGGSRGAATGINYDDLTTTHAALAEAGYAPRSVRMGNCFHDNRTMKALNDLGVEVDSSAVPGRTKDDLGWRMDWLGTPAQAYHPSLVDYRKPGEPQLDILEVPLSVRPLKAPYDATPLLRYLNPCMFREFFSQNLRDTISRSSYLLCIFHPDEAVPPSTGKGHPLVAYSKAELSFNLAHLIEESGRMGRVISFHRLENFARTAVV